MLKLQGYKHNKELKLNEFIYLFLMKLNQEYDTYDEKDYMQCEARRSRSLGDITEICKFYYGEDITKEQVKEILMDFGSNLVGHYCGGMNKRAYGLRELKKNWIQMHTGKSDEYNEIIKYRKDNKYDGRELKKLKELIA